MGNDEVMLTVKMLAYNHEKYIAQAIESVISQKTKYRYELLIGEDCSTDATREIIKRYRDQYPEIIHVIFHKQNMGCTKNSYSLDIHARGKYIAGCEGDDFWCDEERIQKDVDFLEANPQYAGICHRCAVVDEAGRELAENQIPDRAGFWKFDKQIYTLADFQEWKTPGHGSAHTRRNFFCNTDVDYSIVFKASKRVGDRTHLLIAAIEGDIYCADDVVSCYRYRTSGGQGNYMETQKKRNLKAEDFLMMRRLEHWSLQEKGIRLNLDGIKKDRLAGSVVIFLKDPSRENLNVVLRIVRYSGEPLRYLYYAFKTIGIKWFYWKIRGTDALVSL